MLSIDLKDAFSPNQLGKPRGNEKKEKEDIQDPHARAPASPSSSLPFSNEGNAMTFDAAARFRFFRSQRRVLAWEITPHANEENARRNNGSVAYLLYEKKKEKMRMQSRARERTRDPRRRETRTRTRTSHFFPRDGNKRKSEITASEKLR